MAYCFCCILFKEQVIYFRISIANTHVFYLLSAYINRFSSVLWVTDWYIMQLFSEPEQFSPESREKSWVAVYHYYIPKVLVKYLFFDPPNLDSRGLRGFDGLRNMTWKASPADLRSLTGTQESNPSMKWCKKVFIKLKVKILTFTFSP